MRASRNESQAASEEAARQLQSRRDAKQALMARTEADVQLCLQNEMDSRRKQLELASANLSGEIQRQETLWADLSRQIDPEALRPKGQSPQAVCARMARQELSHKASTKRLRRDGVKARIVNPLQIGCLVEK